MRIIFKLINDQVFKLITIEDIDKFIEEHYDTLIYLNCSNCNLTSIKVFPPNLRGFDCSRNKIVYMPDLHITLTVLNCSYNKIEDLPDLPKLIIYFKCSFNNIINIDKYDLSFIQEYHISNQIPKSRIQYLPSVIV